MSINRYVFIIVGCFILALSTSAQARQNQQSAAELNQLGNDLYISGNYKDALTSFEKALSIARSTKDHAIEDDILIGIGKVYASQGIYKVALDNYQQAFAIAQNTNDQDGEAKATEGIGSVYWSQGNYETALDYYEQSLSLVAKDKNRYVEAQALSDIGNVYAAQGDYETAQDYYNRALNIRRAIGDKDGEAETLNNIGALYVYITKYDEALNNFNQALTMMRAVGDRAGEAEALNNLGFLNMTLGNYQKARDYYQMALVITQELNIRPSEANVLNNWATLYDRQGKYDEALNYYRQSLVIVQEFGNRALESACLNNIGFVNAEQGHYDEALSYYQQSLVIVQEIGNRAWQGSALNNIGSLYDSIGQYDKALDYYHQALAISHEIGDQVTESYIINNIGFVDEERGRYGEALNNYQQALKISREIDDLVGQSSPLNNIGLIYRREGRLIEALDYYEQSLKIEKKIGDPIGESDALNNIGSVYDEQGEFEQALNYYEEALDIARTNGDRQGEAITLQNIGLVYHSKEQYDEAQEYYDQSLLISREIGDLREESNTLHNKGRTYFSQGREVDALEYFKQALDIARSIGDRQGESVTLFDLGLINEKLNKPTIAMSYYKAATEVVEGILNSAVLDNSIVTLLRKPENFWPFQRLAVLKTLDDDLETALSYAERGRAVLTRSELAGGIIDFRRNDDSELLATEQKLRLKVVEAQNRLDNLQKDSTITQARISSASETLRLAQQAYEQQIELMQLRGGYLSRQVVREVASLVQIQAALPQDTTLLVYSILSGNNTSGTIIPNHGVVFIITKTAISAKFLNVPEDNFNNLVRSFSIDRKENASFTLRQLYDILILPIADRLMTSRIIVVPDGSLNYIPFAALQAADGSYLIDKYAVSSIPSATVLTLLNNRKLLPAKKEALILAQPDAPSFPELEYARAEALNIAKSLGTEANIQATEADLRTDVQGSRVLTISAHAQLDPFAPLFSAIYLGNGQGHDGRVEVEEIYELDLRSTKLVVLSGCDTGSGGNGEDFGALSKAFMAAGAQQVVASLWSVDDNATSNLIATFMREWKTETNGADALRSAILETKVKYPEPYYWASFVLIGIP
ncbi:MAG: tetratricopeptide repeat protein [Anaerolineaceae bacterium]|nr:tetratricopeptide repeat protein [Anaerolineaceae bacterium]